MTCRDWLFHNQYSACYGLCRTSRYIKKCHGDLVTRINLIEFHKHPLSFLIFYFYIFYIIFLSKINSEFDKILPKKFSRFLVNILLSGLSLQNF